MQPIILYRNDLDWKQEENIVKKYFSCIDKRTQITVDNLVIPRFSALPFYKELENDINYVGARLINTYDQHRYVADLVNWYYDLYEFTPVTWDKLSDIPEVGPFILKGETNSKKFLFNTHMFAKTKQEAIAVHGRLTQDSLIGYQHIYIRQYVPLEKLCDGLQGLPITREYRFFIYKDRILSGGFYWSSHVEDITNRGIIIDPNEVPYEFLKKIIDKIQNTELAEPPTYYVLDVAKTQSGEWILIELNDGCMSGLSENDPDKLYSNLKRVLELEGIKNGG